MINHDYFWTVKRIICFCLVTLILFLFILLPVNAYNYLCCKSHLGGTDQGCDVGCYQSGGEGTWHYCAEGYTCMRYDGIDSGFDCGQKVCYMCILVGEACCPPERPYWVSNACIAGNDCTPGDKCCDNSGNYIPVGTDPNDDCPANCRVCNGMGACTDATAGTDPNNDCSVGSWSCTDSCTRVRNSGDCDGSGCGSNDETDCITGGYVCSGGNEVSPSSSAYCGTSEDCDAGDCSATIYYHACQANNCLCRGGTNGAASGTVTAQAGYSLTNACGTTGTSWCSGTDHCSGETWYDGYLCSGAGACSYDTGAHDKDEASGYCNLANGTHHSTTEQ